MSKKSCRLTLLAAPAAALLAWTFPGSIPPMRAICWSIAAAGRRTPRMPFSVSAAFRMSDRSSVTGTLCLPLVKSSAIGVLVQS